MEVRRGAGTLLPATAELTERIGWFIRLRWVAIAGVALFVLAGGRILSLDLHLLPILVTLGLLALYNTLATGYFHRMGKPSSTDAPFSPKSHTFSPPEGEASSPRLARWLLPRALRGMDYHPSVIRAVYFANTQMMLDLLFLAVLLHFTGGIENPLRLFFLFHVIIAAILLSRRATYAYATLALLLMTAMALGEMTGILPHYTLRAHWRPGAYQEAGLVGAQLFLLGTALFITAYIASSIGARLRKKELEVLRLSFAVEDKASRLETAYSQLSAAEEAKSRYMRKVAHELRGPLGTVQTTLGVALKKMEAGEAPHSRELVGRAWRRTGQLAEMTTKLLTLSRVREGTGGGEAQRLQPRALGLEVLDDVKVAALKSGLTLEVDLSPDIPEMNANPEGLRDLFTNLLGNALHYTPEGGTIRFSMNREGAGFTVEVQDTGIGIEEEALDRIFEEFYRSEAARSHHPDGTGLGMAIAKAVVDQHRGSIKIQSEVGKGTRVRVGIPPIPEPAASSSNSLFPERSISMQTVTHGGRTYEVDDQGFLQNWGDWDEAFAQGEAPYAGVQGPLTEKHWEVIHHIRTRFQETGECPLVYSTCRALKLRLKELEALFPRGYQRGACKLAGLSYRDRFVNYFGEPSRVGESGRGGAPAWAETPITEEGSSRLARKTYRINELGFLVDSSEWDPEYALFRAAELKLPTLTGGHWKILAYLRSTFEETGTVPTVFQCCQDNGMELEDLETLFPDGYHRGAVKLAGLCVRIGGG